MIFNRSFLVVLFLLAAFLRKSHGFFPTAPLHGLLRPSFTHQNTIQDRKVSTRHLRWGMQIFDQQKVIQEDQNGQSYHEVMRQRKEAGGLPRHIAIIMDGNRRYAKALGKPSSFGHLKGKERLEQVIRWVLGELGIQYLTVFALSMENLQGRAQWEVEELLNLMALGLEQISRDREIADKKIKVRVVGALESLPSRLRRAAEEAERFTERGGEGGTLTICIGYGGRQELLQAVKKTGERLC
mmetsp:Transcript_4942/g.17899  ORF Transcript_4942/g.17899 Transcript_4942/m.17899 type:complete len:241 (-) Transcript_4942:332-1054(-)